MSAADAGQDPGAGVSGAARPVAALRAGRAAAGRLHGRARPPGQARSTSTPPSCGKPRPSRRRRLPSRRRSTVEGGLPDVTLPCLGGGRTSTLGELRGPLVVNLWASWCGPCREEMPVLEEFHEQHGDRVPVARHRLRGRPGREAASSWSRETGVTYPLLADPQARLQRRRRRSRPDGAAVVRASSTPTARSPTVVAGGSTRVRRARRPGRGAPRGGPVRLTR